MFGIDVSFSIIAVVCCSLLCIVLVVVTPLLNLLEIPIRIISKIIEFVVGLIGSGPEGCCGCLVLLFGCILFAGLAWVIVEALQTCGTSDAVNFCRLFS